MLGKAISATFNSFSGQTFSRRLRTRFVVSLMPACHLLDGWSMLQTLRVKQQQLEQRLLFNVQSWTMSFNWQRHLQEVGR
jgi:hypothetical protein